MSNAYGNKIGLKIAGIVGVFAVLAGGCAAAYAFSDTVKNQVKLAFSAPEDYLTWVYEKNTADLAGRCGSSYQQYLDRKENGASGQAELRLEPSAEIKDYLVDELFGSSTESTEAQQIIDIIQNVDAVSFSAESTVRGNAASEHLTLSLNDDRLISADLIADLDSTVLFGRIPELTERFAAVDFSAAAEEYLSDDRLLLATGDLPDGEEISDTIKKYSMMLIQNVGEVTVAKKQPLQISGLSTAYTAVTSPMTLNQFLDTMQTAIDSAAVDETLKKLIPDDAEFQRAMLDAGDSLRKVRESGYDLSQKVNLVTYVDATGTVRGLYITLGSDFVFFAAVGMEQDALAAELKLSAAGTKLLSAKVDAVLGETGLSGSGVFSIYASGDRENTFDLSFRDIQLVDAEKGYFSGTVTGSAADSEFAPITLTFSTDGSAQCIAYPLTFEERSIGQLTLTYAMTEGEELTLPDRSAAFEIDPQAMDFDITEYADEDAITEFTDNLLRKMGFSDETVNQLDDTIQYIL